jgi:hypothetical protein
MNQYRITIHDLVFSQFLNWIRTFASSSILELIPYSNLSLAWADTLVWAISCSCLLTRCSCMGLNSKAGGYEDIIVLINKLQSKKLAPAANIGAYESWVVLEISSMAAIYSSVLAQRRSWITASVIALGT